MASREEALICADAPALVPLENFVERAGQYASDPRASSTRKAYLTDFAQFERWYGSQGVVASPATPATVAVYLPSLAAGALTSGHGSPAALSDKSVSIILKRAAKRAGAHPDLVGGPSRRVGFATTAAKKETILDAVMRQTLHKSEKIARSYIRHAKLFDDNAAVGLA